MSREEVIRDLEQKIEEMKDDESRLARLRVQGYMGLLRHIKNLPVEEE